MKDYKALIEEELDSTEDDGMDEDVAIALGLARNPSLSKPGQGSLQEP